MKYLYLFFFTIYVPLLVIYFLQKNNSEYKGFNWAGKNSLGVWLAVLLALFVISAKWTAPSFVIAINTGWQGFRGSGELSYCIRWLIALTLLIFPHVIKKSFWRINPTATEFYSRFNSDGYWYAGLAFAIYPLYETWNLAFKT